MFKKSKCVAYNWNHNTKKITMFKGVLEEGCKNDILKIIQMKHCLKERN